MLPTNVYETLEKVFGFRQFVNAQEKVIETVLSGADALVVMPTGGGKSLCYQLPALVEKELTLVISPLIALMKDQVDALEKKGVAATFINSSLDGAEQSRRITAMRQGVYRLVYIAPERFRQRRFLEALEEIRVKRVAVDEAHCISQWGHDFRPDYLAIASTLKKLGEPQVIALTATATPEVREDIVQQLALRNPQEFVAGFERPNLGLAVKECGTVLEKLEQLVAFICLHRTGIVYAATRKNVEKVAGHLIKHGIPHGVYHAGLSDTERREVQEKFVSGKVPIAVATNAFGMGIDRADLRFVVHYDIPGSVEAYYQEVGRAGRDGHAAECLMLFNYADMRIQEFFVEGANPGKQIVFDVYCWLQDQPDFEARMALREMAEQVPGLGKNEILLRSTLSLLERRHYVERFEIPGQRMMGTRLTQPTLRPEQLELDWKALSKKAKQDRAKLRKMVELAYSRGCRQQFILDYFGEKETQACNRCDHCQNGAVPVSREATPEEVEIVRKALSAVARMSRRSEEKWIGRYGLGKVLMVLQGNRAKEIVQSGLDRLSTYGALKGLSTPVLRNLFEEMKSAGYVEVSTGEYPVITLTKTGAAVMYGQQLPQLKWSAHLTHIETQ